MTMVKMTAAQWIKAFILKEEIENPGLIDSSNVDVLWDQACSSEEHADAILDYMRDLRTAGESTGLPSREYSRHFEQEEVGTDLDGVWVGWTYWYGGGKHACPEYIDWIENAYFLDVHEEEKLVTVRTFKIKDI